MCDEDLDSISECTSVASWCRPILMEQRPLVCQAIDSMSTRGPVLASDSTFPLSPSNLLQSNQHIQNPQRPSTLLQVQRTVSDEKPSCLASPPPFYPPPPLPDRMLRPSISNVDETKAADSTDMISSTAPRIPPPLPPRRLPPPNKIAFDKDDYPIDDAQEIAEQAQPQRAAELPKTTTDAADSVDGSVKSSNKSAKEATPPP